MDQGFHCWALHLLLNKKSTWLGAGNPTPTASPSLQNGSNTSHAPAVVTSGALNLGNSLRRMSFPLSSFPFLREGQGNKEQDSQVLSEGKWRCKARLPQEFRLHMSGRGSWRPTAPLYSVAGEQHCSLFCLSSCATLSAGEA